ncbi:MAG TPA: hypothetical protein ENK05_10405 [Gammaproteobacteria bacterium]|nr:hypothetical protein [Gammaproteobacteria bacterium]
MAKLDSEEKEILTAFERGQLKRVRKAKQEIGRHREIAEGMPYQTLVASILHKFVEGRLSEPAPDENSRTTRKTRR